MKKERETIKRKESEDGEEEEKEEEQLRGKTFKEALSSMFGTPLVHLLLHI